MNQYFKKNIFFKVILFLLTVYLLESIPGGIGLFSSSIIWNLDAAFPEGIHKVISKINFNIIPGTFALVAVVSVISFFQVIINKERRNSINTLLGKFNILHFLLAIISTVMILFASVLLVRDDAGFWNELITCYEKNFIGIFTISILAAIPEELVFRDYIFGELEKKYSWKFATFLIAIFFTLIHSSYVKFNFSRLLSIFISGLFYGIYLSYYKNIWRTIAFHFSCNFFNKGVFFMNEDFNIITSKTGE